MKHDHNALARQQSFNRENEYLNGARQKPRTVYIKLHPKPNAPRHSAIKSLQPRFQSR